VRFGFVLPVFSCSSLPNLVVVSTYSTSPTFALSAAHSFLILLSRQPHALTCFPFWLLFRILSSLLSPSWSSASFSASRWHLFVLTWFWLHAVQCGIWCPYSIPPSFLLSVHLGEGNTHLPLPLLVLPFFMCTWCCSPFKFSSFKLDRGRTRNLHSTVL
jgi:hypothetical protein